MRSYGPKEKKSASVKAMELLLFKSRSEKELRDKLREKDYSPEEVDQAIEYVSSFGYLNDQTYAQQYVSVRKEQKGKAVLKAELKSKGIDPSVIEEALEGLEENEEDTIYGLLLKKAGQPHVPDEKEYRRLYGFFMRRGFSGSRIHKALRKYKEEAEDYE